MWPLRSIASRIKYLVPVSVWRCEGCVRRRQNLAVLPLSACQTKCLVPSQSAAIGVGLIVWGWGPHRFVI